MRSYRWHPCGIEHRSPLVLLRCLLGRDWHVSGAGEWAVVCGCPGGSWARLWVTEGSARAEVDLLDEFGCGAWCVGLHVLGHVDVGRGADVLEQAWRRGVAA